MNINKVEDGSSGYKMSWTEFFAALLIVALMWQERYAACGICIGMMALHYLAKIAAKVQRIQVFVNISNKEKEHGG